MILQLFCRLLKLLKSSGNPSGELTAPQRHSERQFGSFWRTLRSSKKITRSPRKLLGTSPPSQPSQPRVVQQPRALESSGQPPAFLGSQNAPITLPAPGGSRRLPEASGGFWRVLCNASWRLLEATGGFWRLLEAPEAPGGSWRLLETPGGFWRHPEPSGGS